MFTHHITCCAFKCYNWYDIWNIQSQLHSQFFLNEKMCPTVFDISSLHISLHIQLWIKVWWCKSNCSSQWPAYEWIFTSRLVMPPNNPHAWIIQNGWHLYWSMSDLSPWHPRPLGWKLVITISASQCQSLRCRPSVQEIQHGNHSDYRWPDIN